MTEAAQYEGKPRPPDWLPVEPPGHSEKRQALDLLRLYLLSLAHGIISG